jgi:pyrimidine-nucleoside phosphorylase
LAEGIDALVLDVKTGSGSFMKTEKDAAFLAELMVETSQRMGKRTVALITDMDQPLGLRIGNALEVEECVEVLRGQGPRDTRDLSLELAAWMFHLGGRANSIAQGKDLADQMIRSGQALETFCKMAALQGSDPAAIEDPTRLPRARYRSDILSARSGYVSAIRCEDVGTACVVLGGGREKKEDSVDPAVGMILHKKVGDRVSAGEPLCTLLYNSESRAAHARRLIEQGYQVTDAPPAPRPLVHCVIGKAKTS